MGIGGKRLENAVIIMEASGTPGSDMEALKEFWRFLNTDVKDIPWGDFAEQGIDAIVAWPDAAQAWRDNAAQIQQLAPYAQKAAPLIQALDAPVAQLALAGLPFVSVGINLLKLWLEMAKVDPTFEGSVAIVAQLAYLESLETVRGRLQDADTQAKLGQISLWTLIERQLARLDSTELTTAEAKRVITQFRESKLAEQFGAALTEQLQQAGLDAACIHRLVDQVVWGSPRYVHLAIVEAGEAVERLADFYRTGGVQAQERYASIDAYLEKIKKLPLEPVFDETNLRFQDIYVSLQVQPLTQDGEVKEDAHPICSHEWTRQILEKPADQPRQVMFIEGDAGRGKSVFCRMIANWVYREFGDAFIPLWIPLRAMRKLGMNLTETLKNCSNLEKVQFVQQKSDWITDRSTRFLVILDGFDELLLEGRATEDLKDFLKQVIDFQGDNYHQILVTGRPLALQGIDRVISKSTDLDRVRLEPMTDEVREAWLIKWQAAFGEATVNTFRQFLSTCPTDITDTLAREPLLLYLLARLNREGHLSHEMFADAETGPNQEIQAKLRIYRESVNWVLEKQRQNENFRLSGLDDLDDLRKVWQEAAMCVVQSGNETAQLEMVLNRFKAISNPIANLLEQAQKNTGQSEEKALNNLLTTFYLNPGKSDRKGSIEFTHKSFREYLFAEKLIAAFKVWTEIDKRKQFCIDDHALNEQIYDVFGYGGLSQEIVAYLWELLTESSLDRVRLFNRLHEFYQRWHQSEFLDARPNENLPQKKFLQLLDQGIATGLRQVDIFAGLNVMILLFKLHADANSKDYPRSPKNTTRDNIWFHPCGNPEQFKDSDQFEDDRLKRIIHYVDSLGKATFSRIVGSHLSHADLSFSNLVNTNFYFARLISTNLYRADLSLADFSDSILGRANLNSSLLLGTDLSGAILDSANLCNAICSDTMVSEAILDNALLIRTQCRYTWQLTPDQLEGKPHPPLLCGITLPPHFNLDPDRDWDRLAEVLHERYPDSFETLEAAVEWVGERRPL